MIKMNWTECVPSEIVQETVEKNGRGSAGYFDQIKGLHICSETISPHTTSEKYIFPLFRYLAILRYSLWSVFFSLSPFGIYSICTLFVIIFLLLEFFTGVIHILFFSLPSFFCHIFLSFLFPFSLWMISADIPTPPPPPTPRGEGAPIFQNIRTLLGLKCMVR